MSAVEGTSGTVAIGPDPTLVTQAVRKPFGEAAADENALAYIETSST
jgi:hypothetical protein